MYKRKANWVKISNFKTVIKDSAVINAVLSFDRLEKNARKSIFFFFRAIVVCYEIYKFIVKIQNHGWKK